VPRTSLPRHAGYDELYAVEFTEDATPLPCWYCTVLVEHDCAPLVFAYPTPNVSGAVCDNCMKQVPPEVRHYYGATIAGNITLAEQVTRLMDESTGREMPIERAMALGRRTVEVEQAVAHREAVRRAAAAFLIPLQRL
jgi:hypothetical protein